jgi:FtsP/CotA-like multicopper oxidase with cupredoxin domain
MSRQSPRGAETPLTRRDLLKAAAGWGGAYLVSRWGGWDAAAADDPAAARLFGLPASPLVEPEVRRSAAGHLRTRLAISYTRHRIGQDPVYLRSYERSLVGPTLRFRPGDVVEVDLVNQLPAEPPAPHGNGPHGLNTTNLHTHGLHVSPAGPGDNVLLEIAPGQRQHYRFEIPASHPAGTFYYHPHKHGSTAVQLGNGMAGVLIVEGDIDRLPAIAAARERVLVLQQIPYHRKTGMVDWREVAFTDAHSLTTINGLLKSRLELRPREVQRWRLVHAGIKVPHAVVLVDGKGNPVPLYQIAVDGITSGRLEPLAAVELGPGNRADVLVQVERPGTYYLVEREVVLRDVVPERQVLAEVIVAGPPLAMALPSEAELRTLAPLKTLARAPNPGKQRVELWLDGDLHKLDGHPFDPASRPRQLKLGRVDEWTVTVLGEGINIHPFHLHTNPFEVLAINGKRLAQPVWRDTVLVASRASVYPTKEVVFRTRYRDFTGKAMIHCHNAIHEDMGMMQLVEMVA